MNNLNMYCITIYNNHDKLIKKLGYSPVGLGREIVSNNFIKDNTEINISEKNPFYGEYTFHYWLWKNQINQFRKKMDWILPVQEILAKRKTSKQKFKF